MNFNSNYIRDEGEFLGEGIVAEKGGTSVIVEKGGKSETDEQEVHDDEKLFLNETSTGEAEWKSEED